jgi:hypothetical protein
VYQSTGSGEQNFMTMTIKFEIECFDRVIIYKENNIDIILKSKLIISKKVSDKAFAQLIKKYYVSPKKFRIKRLHNSQKKTPPITLKEYNP